MNKSQKSKRLEEANRLLRQKKYAEAANLFFSNRDWNKCAETIIESPPETQVILYHRLQNYLDPNRIKWRNTSNGL